MGDADLPLTHEYVPPDGTRDGPSPAVFVLHGRGADERDLLPIADRLPDGLATVSFRAPDRLMGGYTWYDLDLSGGGLENSQPDPEGFRRSLDLAADSVEAAVDAYDLDQDRLGLLGFSQGAITSFSLLLEYPERYAWVVGLHGYLAATHAGMAPDGIDGKPVFVGAGERDDLIPASRAEEAADRLRSIGCEVTYRTYDAGHGVGPDELADVVGWVTDVVG